MRKHNTQNLQNLLVAHPLWCQTIIITQSKIYFLRDKVFSSTKFNLFQYQSRILNNQIFYDCLCNVISFNDYLALLQFTPPPVFQGSQRRFRPPSIKKFNLPLSPVTKEGVKIFHRRGFRAPFETPRNTGGGGGVNCNSADSKSFHRQKIKNKSICIRIHKYQKKCTALINLSILNQINM